MSAVSGQDQQLEDHQTTEMGRSSSSSVYGRVAEVDCKERRLAVPSVLFMTLSTKFRLTKHEWDLPHLSRYIMMA